MLQGTFWVRTPSLDRRLAFTGGHRIPDDQASQHGLEHEGEEQGQIMVDGGERLDTVTFQLVPTMELFAPGVTGWVQEPQLPVAIHGTTGASVGGECFLIGGANVVGTASPNPATKVCTPGL